MAVDETPPSEIVERSLSFAGSTIKARYRVNEVSAVRRDIAAHPEFVAAVRAQASTLAISPHAYRGLQRVYACDLTERGELFLALEPVKGITLREFIDTRGPLELSTALRIASQVASSSHHCRP